MKKILCISAVVLALAVAPLRAATAKTGIEVLRYQLNWPGGVPLGEAQLKTIPVDGQWKLELTLDASMPAFQVIDRFNSSVNEKFCSLEFSRDTLHGAKKSKETTTFDLAATNASRKTEGGGTKDFSTAACPHDALGFLFFARQELIKGRVPAAQTIYYGGPYDLQFEMLGSQALSIGGAQTQADRFRVSFKGPVANSTFEVFFSKNAARTPLLIKVPFSLGTFSMELMP